MPFVIERWREVAVVVTIMFLVPPSGGTAAATSPAEGKCAAPVYRQFDFWAGDWQVFEVGGTTPVAHVRVDSILEGCALREDYQGADGHKGQSFTIYDATRKVWHQTWVTNRGELLEIEGTLVNGSIVLTGEDHSKRSIVRGTWKPEKKDEVRETAVTSSDGGKTWIPWFDLIFRHSDEGRASQDSTKKKGS